MYIYETSSVKVTFDLHSESQDGLDKNDLLADTLYIGLLPSRPLFPLCFLCFYLQYKSGVCLV